MQVKETERLLLNEFAETDTAFILELLNTKGWIEFIGDRGIKSEEDARNYLVNGPMASYAKNGFGLWRVDLKSTGGAIGMCGLIKRDTLEDIDIGFAFLPEFSGQGFAFEAAQACMDYAKEKLELKRVVAITVPSNQSSIRLLEKLGLQFEKEIQEKDEKLFLYGISFPAKG